MNPGTSVTHARFGRGTVVAESAGLLIVQFDAGLQACPPDEVSASLQPLERLASLRSVSEKEQVASSAEALCRVQAMAIRSVNDAWGIFSRSRIELLPHQLWVCRQVTRELPARFLVADDVGLGKTVEAGLIISSFKLAGRLDRLLVLCPASLVQQWRDRLRKMFDLHSAEYLPAADRAGRAFWEAQPVVVASTQTLRMDRGGRWDRMLAAPPWDLVVVDEAHHLNADEDRGGTLGHNLVRELDAAGRIRSMVFFTGTPHRGKEFGFRSLLSLLRPDQFDPKGAPPTPEAIRSVMIRNNKQRVTNLAGEPLFHRPRVTPREYRYSPAEQAFYDTLTDFIVGGKAYASGMERRAQGEAIRLVLVSLQKLASSSVAAILAALRKRRARLNEAIGGGEETPPPALPAGEEGVEDLDAAAEAVESEAERSVRLSLHADEAERLGDLIELAEAVARDGETKLDAILEHVAGLPADASVLFFTEYKATQSLLLSQLHRRFGPESTAFINGDGRARGVWTGGDSKLAVDLTQDREDASRAFNAGRVRFLVSTEAAGEGIDLQQRCHCLVHVDLPWNPMRLHQRVGRLNRFGQKERVQVTYFHNPETVESRIWAKLNEKIERITTAYGAAMDDPEDVLDLVLGVQGSNAFEEVFAEAGRNADRLDDWFDRSTSTFGGRDAVEAAQRLVGSANRFDFGRDAKAIPSLRLEDLRPFFENMLRLQKRRILRDQPPAIGFKTPDAWLFPAVARSYEGLHFDRELARETDEAAGNLVGVGLSVFDVAVAEAIALEAPIASLAGSSLKEAVAVFRVHDRNTSSGERQSAVCGVGLGSGLLLRDSDLLQALHHASAAAAAAPSVEPVDQKRLADLEAEVAAAATTLGVAATHPAAELIALLMPLHKDPCIS